MLLLSIVQLDPKSTKYRYLTNQAFPTFPITGSRNKQQLLENLQAGDVVLSADTLGYLENGTGQQE
jgi:aryl-alcohol dehydrogenase-like predicted oxidoreductase